MRHGQTRLGAAPTEARFGCNPDSPLPALRVLTKPLTVSALCVGPGKCSVALRTVKQIRGNVSDDIFVQRLATAAVVRDCGTSSLAGIATESPTAKIFNGRKQHHFVY